MTRVSRNHPEHRGNGEHIPYISAATMLSVTRDDPNEHTYTELVDAIRIHGHDAQADIEELYRRVGSQLGMNKMELDAFVDALVTLTSDFFIGDVGGNCWTLRI